MWYEVLIALIFSNVSKLFILLFFATYHMLFFNLINCLKIKSVAFKTMFLNAFGFIAIAFILSLLKPCILYSGRCLQNKYSY